MNNITILAAADWHHYYDEEIEMLKGISFDMCTVLGDIPAKAVKILKELSRERPIIGVAGNHDDWDTPEKGGAENIHTKTVNYLGYTFAGLSGSAKYKVSKAPMLTQDESIELCRRIGKADIFLSHDCMFYLLGKDTAHEGLMGIDRYIMKNHPKLNLCGHHHISVMRTRYDVPTICIYRCALVTFPKITVTPIF